MIPQKLKTELERQHEKSSGIAARYYPYQYTPLCLFVLMEKIHFWDLPEKVEIKLNSDFRKRFFSDVVKYFGSSNKAGAFIRRPPCGYTSETKYKGSVIRRIKTAKDGGKYEYCHVWMIIKLARKIDYDLEHIERNIVGYRARGGHRISKEFPLSVTPEFTAILAHFMGDGTESRTKDVASTYMQVNDTGLMSFYNKMTNVFGETDKNLISNEERTVFIPKPINLIIKDYFSIKRIGAHVSYVPKKVLSMPSDHRLAFLTAFLVDEGAIYDTVCFRVANKKLAGGVRRVAMSLGYKCSKPLISRNKKCDIYGFSISNYSIGKMLDDINKLSKTYPTCNLAQKQLHFEYLANLSRHCGPKRKIGETKKLILSAIENEPKTVIDISKSVGVGRRTVRIHLGDFEKEDKVVMVEEKPKGAKLWLAK